MKTTKQLVQEFADGIAAQAQCIKQGNPKTGNRHADKAVRAFNALRAMGNPGRDALVPLLADPRPDVRVSAAAFLLRHRHAEARAVLEKEAKGEGIVAFGADQAIKRWDEGGWELDPRMSYRALRGLRIQPRLGPRFRQFVR